MDKAKKAYSEVSAFLNLIREEEKNMIPKDILQKIDSYRDNKNLSFNKDGEIELSEEAKSIILYLYETYILSSNSELKNAFHDRLEENDRIHRIIKSKQKKNKKEDF